MKLDFSERILLGLTGWTAKSVITKIKDVDKRGITTAALFMEIIKDREDREKIYSVLKKSKIQNIPLVHIRQDMTRDEIEFLKENYKTKHFTIHEEHFSCIPLLKGYYKSLYLELNTDNFVSKKIKIEKIGGFCIDLSHFKVEEQKWTKEFLYVLSKKDKKVFGCNHINGYSYKKNRDLHTVKKLSDFDYLATLPEFLFGEAIAIEAFNSIESQIKFKKYLVKFLNQKFNKVH